LYFKIVLQNCILYFKILYFKLLVLQNIVLQITCTSKYKLTVAHGRAKTQPLAYLWSVHVQEGVRTGDDADAVTGHQARQSQQEVGGTRQSTDEISGENAAELPEVQREIASVAMLELAFRPVLH